MQGACSTNPPFVLEKHIVGSNNAWLSGAAIGIPETWGRCRLSLQETSSFKSEDYKKLGLYYGPVIFIGQEVDRKITELWFLNSLILSIVFNATPKRTDIVALRRTVAAAHALFSDVFYVDEDHAFCFTPISHALLHLPDMFEFCGPLTNVIQFVVEGLVGEVGSLVQSKQKPKANLMKKSLTLLCLRLVIGESALTEMFIARVGMIKTWMKTSPMCRGILR